MIENLQPYPEYKGSGQNWLDDVPKHWSLLPNRALFDQVKDKNHPNEELLSVTIKRGILPQRELLADSSKKDSSNANKAAYKLLCPGDIAYNKMRAWQGAFGRSSYRGIISPAYVVVRPRANVDSWYFHHLYRTPGFAKEAERWSYGIDSDMWSLRPEHFKVIGSILPPPDEQAVIVRFLDHANRKIDTFIRTKRKLIGLLKEQKQTSIHCAVTRGLESAKHLKTEPALEEQSLVDELSKGISNRTTKRSIPWLGAIPSHWSVAPSRRFFKPRKERALPGDVQLSATQAYGVIPQAEFEQKVGRRVVKIFQHLEKRRHVEKDDFVISMRSFQGGLERAWASGCIRSSYVVLQAASPIDPAFFGYLFKSRGYIKALQTTSIFIRDGQDLNFNNFRLVDLPVVPLHEQKDIAKFLDQAVANFDTAISRARNEIELLDEYRTRLTTDIVTGKLDVREAANSLAEAADERAMEDLTSDLEEELQDEPEMEEFSE